MLEFKNRWCKWGKYCWDEKE